MEIKEYFSPYFIVLSLIAGLYMLKIQGPNLIKVDHLNREGEFLKKAGGVYIALGVIGVLLWLF